MQQKTVVLPYIGMSVKEKIGFFDKKLPKIGS
jgi:hypothetical protein